jgi:hypothetical protein
MVKLNEAVSAPAITVQVAPPSTEYDHSYAGVTPAGETETDGVKEAPSAISGIVWSLSGDEIVNGSTGSAIANDWKNNQPANAATPNPMRESILFIKKSP